MDKSNTDCRHFPDLRLCSDLQLVFDSLTSKQRAFVFEYPIDLNATQAAIRAGYSRKTAHVIGHENLKKPDIWCVLEYALDLKAQRCSGTAQDVESEFWGLYRECRAKGNHATARACLKDLGEYLSMFIRLSSSVDSGAIEARLREGRQRMNVDNKRSSATIRKAHAKAEMH